MKRLIWLLSLSILAACGGGGGSDDGGDTGGDNGGNTGGDATVERVSLTGLAVKGLARNAKVEAFSLSGSNFKTTADAVTSTNAQGRYSVVLPESLGEYSGPLKIRLSYQAGAELQCDVEPNCVDGSVNFGDFYAMPEDFELTAVVNVGSGLINDNGDTIANVSSLTTLATNFLTRDGNTISATTLKTSNNQVRAVFSLPKSVDLVATEPQVVTSEDFNGDEVYGAVNAAFLKLSEDSDTSLTSVLSNVSQQLITNNGQVYKRAPDNDSSPSILTISTAANAYLEDGQLDEVITQAEQAAAGSITNINPPSISVGVDKTVNGGDTVTLPLEFILPEGGESALTDPKYLWQVLSGPLELLTNSTATTNTLVFTAPNDGGVIKLRALIEADEGSDNDIVIVNVKALTTADTSRSGSYLNSGAKMGLYGGGSLLGHDHEVFMDEYDLTFNSDGSGSAARSEGNTFAFYENTASLSQIGSVTLEERETEVGTVPASATGQLSFQQLASGGIVVSAPGYISEEQSETDPNVVFREQSVSRQIRFYDFGGGLYVANPFFYDAVTKIENGVQEAEPSDIRVASELVSLHKANSISNVSEFSNKEFIGFQWWVDIDDSASSFVTSVVKSEFNFNADGSAAAVNENIHAIDGIPNTDHNAANTVYTISS